MQSHPAFQYSTCILLQSLKEIDDIAPTPQEEEKTSKSEEISDEEPLVKFVKSKAKAKKNAKVQSLGRLAVINKATDKGKKIMDSKKKDSPPGSIIHVIDENDEETDSINPYQFQKMAKTTYESHLKKIEVS